MVHLQPPQIVAYSQRMAKDGEAQFVRDTVTAISHEYLILLKMAASYVTVGKVIFWVMNGYNVHL